MNLMFWKKKAPGGTEEGEADDDRTVAISRDTAAGEENAEEPVRPGLLARLRNTLAALRKPRAPVTETDGGEAETPEAAAPASRDDEMPGIAPAHNLKKRLIVGGAIGLLVLLLAGIGFAITKIFLSEPEQKSATTKASQTSHPAPPAETPPTEARQAEIDKLKKKNAELQAQIEAMQKEPPQQPLPAPTSTASVKNATAASSGDSDEMTISNKDPKAAAQALKAAIEAMNAGSGGEKPHKPGQ